MRKGICKKWIACLSAFALLTTLMSFACAAESAAQAPIEVIGDSISQERTYDEYYLQYGDMERPSAVVSIDAVTDLTAAADLTVAISSHNQREAVILEDTNSWAQWNFRVETSGVYPLWITFCPMTDEQAEIDLQVLLDGDHPFEECRNLTLQRLWKDSVTDNSFKKDRSGNDIRPDSLQILEWNAQTLFEPLGLYAEPYLFYLEAGDHTLQLASNTDLAINEIRFENAQRSLSYSEYKSQFSNELPLSQTQQYRLEAEMPLLKNTRSIYPTFDNGDCSTLPNDPNVICLNTIGKGSWKKQGEYLVWEVPVKEAGLYEIVFRARQNENPSSSSYRTLKINGELPFREAQNIEFPYRTQWYIQSFGAETPYYVWLEPGDTVTLECTTTEDSSAISRNISSLVRNMNAIYRQIIVVTGTSPDIYRDYALEKKIPTLLSDMQTAHELLEETVELMSENRETPSPNVSTVQMTADVLQTMIKNPYAIAEKLGEFKDAIESLGSLIQTVGENPLELDCIFLVPNGQSLQSDRASFWESLVFSFKRFIASFITDYYASDSWLSVESKSVSVWASAGRDQLQILNTLIDHYFISETGTSVTLSLVDTGGTLIQATLAGKGPDVALMIDTATPVNLAMRGALADLSDFDLDSIWDDYFESCWTPYRYNDGIYAIPETQTFDVLFYRSDIFEELELTVPETWEDFYRTLEILQHNNLSVGVPEINAASPGVSSGIAMFNKFLLQNGGAYYNDSLTRTMFDTNEAYDAFAKWVQLYREYGLARSYDFFNYFRSGEIAMALQNYSSYNQLKAAAPELRGLWGIAPIPGTVREDGSIDRAETSGGTGCMMMKSAVDRGAGESAFSFMKWWTSAEIQTLYAQELEAQLGVVARYTPASLKAFDSINWTKDEHEVLFGQWKEVVNIPEIPGNYVIPRELTNAFRKALTATGMVERQLDIYNKAMNDEITRKREEFQLD